MSDSRTDVASLTVRLGAVAKNYRICRSFAPGTAMAAVVKANGYGLGAAEIAGALTVQGCDTFFVTRLEEGVALRPVVPAARVFVLDGIRENAVAMFTTHGLIPVLNSLDEITLWGRLAKGREAAIHIDTGMSRLGLPPSELATLAKDARKRLADINVVLLMSHLACAEDVGSPMNSVQLDRFKAALSALPPAPASLAASAGLMLGPDYAFDLVRPGIALYGGKALAGAANPFAVAAQLTGRILQLRRVDKGEGVGYGASFRAERPTTLATVALGYADGLLRSLSNRGAGAIARQKAPIVGRVSMDIVMLDVTAVPDQRLAVGAEVEFLGDTMLLDDVAATAGTITHEILTSLGRRVMRRYTDEAVA